MTKDVILKVQGLQIAPGETDETIELIAPGTYYFKNGKHYFVYDEVMEGYSETTRSIVKVSEDYMELTKRGVVNVHMLFEREKQNVTYYYTPFGSLLIGINASSVTVAESEAEIAVEVHYALEINNQHMADCRMNLTAVPRNRENFRIL